MRYYTVFLIALFLVALPAIGLIALAEEPAGIDLCAFARTATEAELLSADPVNEAPCDPWDPSMWNEADRECTYVCGTVVHVEAM